MSAPAPQKRFDLNRRVTLVAIGQALAKASQLIIGAVLVRALTDHDWSRMALILSVYQAAIGIGGLNIQQSIYFFFTRLAPTERRSFVFQNVGLLSGSALVTALILLILAEPIGGGHYQVAHLIPWIALAVLLEIPTAGIPELLISAERPGVAAAAQAGLSILQVLAVCLPIAAGGGLESGVYGLMAYVGLRLVFFALLVAGVTEPRPGSGPPWRDIPWQRVKDQLIYVAPLSLTITISLLNRNLDKWYLAALAPEDYGTYVIAGTEVPFVSMLAGALGAVLATRLVRAFRDGAPEYARAIFMAGAARMSLLVLPITTGIIVAAPELLGLLFTKGYSDAALPFQIFSIILIQRVAEYGVVLRAAGDTRSLWWASLVLVTSNAILSLLGLLAGGMIGAALGTLIANMLAWWFALSRISRVLHHPIRHIFPWALYLRVLATALPCGALAWLAAALLPAGTHALLTLGVKVAVFVSLYLLAARAQALSKGLPPIPADRA